MWPWETGIVWTYGLDWKPVPTSRTPLAYTPWLDQLDADSLASADGPQRVLRHAAGPPADSALALAKATPYSIDHRYGAWDSPAATRALLCHFEALRTTPRYQVLGRVPNRCGSPRLLSSKQTGYGQQVRIPKPRGHDQVVFARIHGTPPSGLEALRAFFFRAPISYVAFDSKAVYRVVPNVLADGPILDASAGTDFPKPFALAPQARTVALFKQGGALTTRPRLRFDFYAMRVRPLQPHRGHVRGRDRTSSRS